MIRAIAAVDDRLGLATDEGIPWTIPADVAHFRSAIASTDVLMGYSTYLELGRPMEAGVNYVATRRDPDLRPGFEPVADVASFLASASGRDLWVVGGAGLYASTLSSTDELVLTRIDGDFHCTKFFPPFEESFALETDTPSPAGAVPAFRFQTWRRSPAPN